MIKVIASDMDGTLLGDNHELAKETIWAIHDAQEAGIRFIIATGRNYHMAMSVLENTDIVCDYLLSSGAEVRNSQKQIVSNLELDIDLCEKIYETIRQAGGYVIFCGKDSNYQVGDRKEIETASLAYMQLFFQGMPLEQVVQTEMYKKMQNNTEVMETFQVLKASGIVIYKIFMYSLDTQLVDKIQKQFENDSRLAVASSMINNLEFTDIRAQKGPVLKTYIESLGYTMDEVMTLGDSMNDYSMIAMDFGATVAMENAVPELKAAAKYLTKSNNELGVAFAIHELLKREGYPISKLK